MALDGIILDLDGTLVDTNALHVEAWRRAFEQSGYNVARDRIAAEIGEGGDFVVPSILGKAADEKDGDALRKAQPKEYGKLASEGVQIFPEVRELLAELHKRGLRLILATSSAAKQLEVTEKASGLQVRKLVDEVVTADDAAQSKPAPDLVKAALKKAKLSPAQCIMLGDTVYDAESARKAGVACIGLLCGGNSQSSLLSAGARLTYRDAADLLAHLDEALAACSPGPSHLTSDLLEKLMRAALDQAEQGLAAGEVPIGCVLARGDGEIIAAGFNEMNRSQNKAAHAEMVTFTRAAGKVPLDARDLLLVSTLEPCVMCTGAAMVSAVDTIVFGLRAPADSGTMRVSPPHSPESQMPRIVGDILYDQSRMLLERWLKANQESPQAAYVTQLLADSPQ